MTRAMLVAVLYRMEGKPGVTGTTAFTDVAAGVYYADAVTWAANNGIVYGMSDKTFSPNTHPHPGADGCHDAPLCKLQEA